MKVKELQKTVNIAWSPQAQHPLYLAAGTAAQQLDSNANSQLEIYDCNFADASYDLALKASLPSQYRFQKLIWSATGFGAAHANGLLVGGCEGGHIMIYSAAKLLAAGKHEESLLARQDKHTGAVSGLDVNPFQNNLLASCASESEIFIWDLNNTSTHMNPGAKTQPLEDVKNVAWNRQVQHILASVFSSRCVIWDLRKSEQIIKLCDTQSRVRWHAIQWHPDVATQVWLASEDDQAPVVQLWDLRYATAPAKTMQIHQRGVLGMSWCAQDSDLMVSCGKDNRIYCWNPNTEAADGEILSEVATTATWYSDVQWCTRNPALIASSCLDGNVSIYSLFGGAQQQQVPTSNKIADSFPGMAEFAQAPHATQTPTQTICNDLKRAPKWLKPAAGVSFGFGGKLLHFNAQSKAVKIMQIVTEPELVQRANALEQALAETNYAEYCRQRADEMTDQHGRYLWYFIKANFELNPREEMLNLLGYDKQDTAAKFARYIKHVDDDDDDEAAQNEVEALTNRIHHLTHQTANDIAVNQNVENVLPPTKQFKIPSGEHPDSLLTEALITGNLEAAVELCLENQRIAEALIIASHAGNDYLLKIQNRYLQQQKQNCEISHVLSALISCDWFNFINSCTVDSWKQALVAALKHSERKVDDICERLGDRLLRERGNNSVEYMRNAILCYICAGSIDKIVSAWYELKQLEQQNAQYKLSTQELQELAEVVLLMCKSMEQQGIALELNSRFGDFISEYGGLLASQGALTAALSYIFALGQTSECAKLDELRERLYNTLNYKQQQQQQQPANSKNVYARTQAAQQHQQQQQQQRSGSITQTQFQQQQQQYAPTQFANNIFGSTVPAAPLLFNPALAANTTAAPPPSTTAIAAINDNLAHPPRPLSTSSSQAGSGLLSRSKYVLDPSVAAAAPIGYGNNYNNPAVNSYNPSAYNANNYGNAPAVPNFNNTPFSATSGSNYMQPNQPTLDIAPPPTAQSTTNMSAAAAPLLRNPTPPPGWNDPPALKSNRVKKTEPQQQAITHPIFGVDPNQNGYIDANAQYQKALPPPMSNAEQSYNAVAPTNAGGYLNAMAPPNNNLPITQMLPQQQQYNFQTSAIAQQQQQQQPPQQWSTAAQYEQPAVVQRQPELPKEKLPLPEEFIYLQTVLEELKNQCLLAAASDARTKRKFVDVAKRLENLYACLRDGRLTQATIAALNQIVQFIQVGDYNNALQTQTQIAFGSDFSQCAGFMPGLKVLVQSAVDLQVFLR